MARKTVVEKILETLTSSAIESAYLFVAISQAGYGASRKQIEKKLEEIKAGQQPVQKSLHRKRHSFYSTLSYLKKDGMIEKAGDKWRITPRGKEKLIALKIHKRPEHERYKSEHDDILKIVMFDIPEKERWKRDWLRDALTMLGFRLVQKSVWAGKKRIPKEFLEDLARYNILDYVDMFTVTKSGSLRSWKGNER